MRLGIWPQEQALAVSLASGIGNKVGQLLLAHSNSRKPAQIKDLDDAFHKSLLFLKHRCNDILPKKLMS